MDDAYKKSVKTNEAVAPESEVKQLRAKMRELERQLGKKTMETARDPQGGSRDLAGKEMLSHGNSSDEGGWHVTTTTNRPPTRPQAALTPAIPPSSNRPMILSRFSGATPLRRGAPPDDDAIVLGHSKPTPRR